MAEALSASQAATAIRKAALPTAKGAKAALGFSPPERADITGTARRGNPARPSRRTAQKQAGRPETPAEQRQEALAEERGSERRWLPARPTLSAYIGSLCPSEDEWYGSGPTDDSRAASCLVGPVSTTAAALEARTLSPDSGDPRASALSLETGVASYSSTSRDPQASAQCLETGDASHSDRAKVPASCRHREGDEVSRGRRKNSRGSFARSRLRRPTSFRC